MSEIDKLRKALTDSTNFLHDYRAVQEVRNQADGTFQTSIHAIEDRILSNTLALQDAAPPLTFPLNINTENKVIQLYPDGTCNGGAEELEKYLNELQGEGDPMRAMTLWLILRAMKGPPAG